MLPTVEYRPLSALQPIKLKYEYPYDEELNRINTQYSGGIRIESIKGFKNFQDISLNKGNALILTNTVELNDVFTGTYNTENTITGTVLLQLGTSSTYFMTEETSTGRVTISRKPSFIHAISIKDTKEVELQINGKFLQVEKEYPYTVYLSETSLGEEEIYRQRFFLEKTKNVVSFRAIVKDGQRYLAFNNDDILRATGTMLNSAILNDYRFNVVEVTAQAKQKGFVPSTDVVSYFMSFKDKKYNKNVYIRERKNVKTNLLASFSVYEANLNGYANINFANLRTNYTPEGASLIIPLTSTDVPEQGLPQPPIVIVVPPAEPPPPPPEVIPDDTLLKEDGYPLVQENNFYISLE